jgi:hypothetical protein
MRTTLRDYMAMSGQLHLASTRSWWPPPSAKANSKTAQSANANSKTFWSGETAVTSAIRGGTLVADDLDAGPDFEALTLAAEQGQGELPPVTNQAAVDEETFQSDWNRKGGVPPRVPEEARADLDVAQRVARAEAGGLDGGVALRWPVALRDSWMRSRPRWPQHGQP